MSLRKKDQLPHKSQPIYTTPRDLLYDLLRIFIGSALCAEAVNAILIPKHFATGGITGLCLIIFKAIPVINIGWIYFLINIPLFLMAWKYVGRRFFLFSIIGVLSFTVAVSLIHIPIHVEDNILGALLAGLIFGAGTGIALLSSGSQGGLDILSVMLLRRFSITLGNTFLAANLVILVLVAAFYSIDALLYTLIVIYVSSKITNIVVTGLSQRKAVLIISPHWETISREVLKDIRRGVTIIQGQGGFSGQQEHILYTVVPLMEIGQVKSLIRQIDPDAFVVISDTLEVVNNRLGNQPHW
jgi:uncharacterized membrane-anchored protein YitT (DUF2179 family)